jgi:hypothetical protein
VFCERRDPHPIAVAVDGDYLHRSMIDIIDRNEPLPGIVRSGSMRFV